jgi:pyridoxal biosynthesis lyase PdxS
LIEKAGDAAVCLWRGLENIYSGSGIMDSLVFKRFAKTCVYAAHSPSLYW